MPTSFATEGGGPTHYFGSPVRVDANTGKVLSQVSSAQSCRVWDIAPSGHFVCQTARPAVSVRRLDETEIWQFAGDYYLDLLAPNEQHVAVGGTGGGSDVLGADGIDVKLPNTFFYTGWLDVATLIGGGYDKNFNYVSLGAPNTVVDIGFKGLFIGTV